MTTDPATARAMPSPMPPLPPVTSATVPARAISRIASLDGKVGGHGRLGLVLARGAHDAGMRPAVRPPTLDRRPGDAERRHRERVPQLADPARAAFRRRGDDVGAVEAAAIAGVQVAFRLQAFGEQDVVAVQLDMPVGDAVHRHLRNRRAVGEAFDRDQHAVDRDGVAGTEPQRAMRQTRAERAGGDAVGPDFSWLPMTAAIDLAMAEPTHRGGAPVRGEHRVADAQSFDHNFAARGADAGAGAEALGGVAASDRVGLRQQVGCGRGDGLAAGVLVDAGDVEVFLT
jgi:hypothetical protein